MSSISSNAVCLGSIQERSKNANRYHNLVLKIGHGALDVLYAQYIPWLSRTEKYQLLSEIPSGCRL
jgi:hypothetical protein